MLLWGVRHGIIIGIKILSKKNIFCSKLNAIFKGSKNKFRQQVWGLGIFPHHYLAILKISWNWGRQL